MKILHYALGFPPFRRGGMTKYCIDLMKEQALQGNSVSMLWPGVINKYGKTSKIYKRISHCESNIQLESYEIINPLPVSLLDGIKDVEAYTQAKDMEVFRCFFEENQFDVLHVHTLMGLPIELLQAAKMADVRLVYTTHDYFGICPKWGLFKNSVICVDDHECSDCVFCNRTAMSLKKVQLLQSPIYRILKENRVVKLLRQKHNQDLNSQSKEINAIEPKSDAIQVERYRRLRNYYIEMLDIFDVIHCNSQNTKDIFLKYSNIEHSAKVVSITNAEIIDHRKIRNYNFEKLNIGYLGSITEHKGFYFLRDTLDEIYKENKNFQLHIYCPETVQGDYIINHGMYMYSELARVMDEIDLLVVPSLWYETFGFTVLEALSYGVPVIVTENVGAKDLLQNEKFGFIVAPVKSALIECLSKVLSANSGLLQQMNLNILQNMSVKTMKEHTVEIQQEIYQID